MTYEDTLHYLYTQLPVFQHTGANAYKPGLQTSMDLDTYLGNPHRRYRTIHIAGTNGKGSTSHTLAAILQESGYKVGLYTSPHLVDFRERIRVNGAMIPKEQVIQFVEQYRADAPQLSPSFFELTMAMAFDYFAQSQVDVAVIETGLGGRLDSTNIITPDLSIITNISFDHTQFLGNTLPLIAMEKAGIIKEGVPVVIGEADEETAPIFCAKSAEMHAPIIFAQATPHLLQATPHPEGGWNYTCRNYPHLRGELGGIYQQSNTNTVLAAVEQLQKLNYTIPTQAVCSGFENVVSLTGLLGRWQQLFTSPRTVCDTGHNTAGISLVVEQLKNIPYKKLHIVMGMVNDKDITGVLALLPAEATYYFTQANIARALPAEEMQEKAAPYGLIGESYSTVAEAFEAAHGAASTDDFIYIGGSTFVVADLLSYLSQGSEVE